MKVGYTIIVLIYFAVLLIYPATSLILVRYIYRNSRARAQNDRMLSIYTIIFLAFCITAPFCRLSAIIEVVGNWPFVFFLLVELAYIWKISSLAIRDKRIKYVLAGLFFTLSSYLAYLSFQPYHILLYDPFFAIESFVIVTVSFLYFLQLGDEISTQNVLQNRITILMLGIFICYSLPFIYNSSRAIIWLLEPNYLDTITNDFEKNFVLLSLSLVGNVCYLILNLFIYKAFKCKTEVHLGI